MSEQLLQIKPTVPGHDYWSLRKALSKVIPRQTKLLLDKGSEAMVQEKGRKKNYQQFDLVDGEWKKQERLLSATEVNSFVEVSLRASACPMPMNLDVWDGLTCPYKCQYCFANSFRASLYTAFFDNSKSIGIRHCNPDMYKRELDKLMAVRGTDPQSHSDQVKRAVAMGIPMRLGIRFEDFLPIEGRDSISLGLLQHLADYNYPVMINTKSGLVGDDRYVEALARNTGKAAVHITMISSNNGILKPLEPGAPPFEKRIAAAAALVAAGIRVVARIEPHLLFVNDNRDDVMDYIEKIREAGINNITFDTYSYSAWNAGIRQAFYNLGYDFDRIFLLGSDSQPVGSLLLGAFMDVFRAEGFSVSSFDMGNVPANHQTVCCEVGDHFAEAGFNYGCSVVAARYIKARKTLTTCWKDFEAMVMQRGGFLSDELRDEMKRLWNCQGNDAYSHQWAAGCEPCGNDEDGLVWKFNETSDFRLEVLKGIL